MPQKPVKKSHFEGIKELYKINNYLVDMDRDMFNFYQYFLSFPKVYRQDALPTIPNDSIALWEDTVGGKFYWIVNIDGTQKALDFASNSSATINHAALTNLDYIHAGHTGFEQATSKGDISVGTPLTLLGGTTTLVNGNAYISITQASASSDGYLSSGNWTTFNNKADYNFGSNIFYGTGNFITTGTLSGNVVNANTVNVNGQIYGKGYFVNPRVVSTSTYNVVFGDDCLALASATTATLPVASGSGKSYYFKNVAGVNTTVRCQGIDTIDGDASQTLYSWEGIHVIDYFANSWVVV
jgi:hypothetical protein